MSANFFTHDPTLHRVFGHAISIEPGSLYATLKDIPRTKIQPTLVTQAVDYLRDNHLREHDPTLEMHSSLLDVRMLTHTALDTMQPPLPLEEALAVADDERTAHVLAQIALVPSEYYREKVWSDPSIITIEAKKYMAIAPGILPNERMGKGCPFAGDNPEKKLYPIFLKYASWAAKLCTYEYYHDRSLMPNS